jgi:hypothetical protein
MFSSDGFDEANQRTSLPGEATPARGVDSHLVESLIFALLEKGVLTKNDALGVVETVAQVIGGAVYDGVASEQTTADLNLLHRLYTSFEMLDDRPGVVNSDADNVHRLRPPLHGDRPKFPHDD